METVIHIPKEEDIRRWVKEAAIEVLNELKSQETNKGGTEPLITRVETAKMLDISLVTLTDWVKRGLPCHKNRGRVYFLKSEIVDYLREKKEDLP